MTNPMRGVFAVPTTPFDEDGEQHLDRLAARVDEVLGTGVEGILCLGATGEALALSDAEREAQIRAIVDAAGGRANIVVGCMAYTPAQMSEHIANAQAWGADAAMITPPFYGGLEPDSATAALHQVMTNSPLPVMVYNNQHSTGTDLLPEHLATLADTGALWSVKETSGAATRIRELRRELGTEVEVFVGADGIALEGFSQGASGWVAASAWLLPQQCQTLWAHARDGRWAEAIELWNGLSDALAQIEDNPAFISLIKQSLSRRGIDQGPVRPPLPTADAESLEGLLATITALEKGL
ncbi:MULTISPECIES: dihydrodipicolinate synthase family protein [unclassified Brevibacterium]|uniref:dihydrodipicolinate synthase family protein n=1 Tax=unclassified Brevibacterium TaxID=2614124 RepID=UPI001E31678B|nr:MULTISPECIES: dihydrodipicolinate synthase family protein [unclassified Brevibacterium]MCD1284305.1 dihydrodipicolinate synthase family protein [Brevibacterium sp. CCUG 69071]MDK8436084.1 dihydrodipicolinate synthase family protein [Brevibacterium sp. H-BE7]